MVGQQAITLNNSRKPKKRPAKQIHIPNQDQQLFQNSSMKLIFSKKI